MKNENVCRFTRGNPPAKNENTCKYTRGNSPIEGQQVVPLIIRRKPLIDTRVERQIITGMIVSDRFMRDILPLCSLDLFQAKFSRRVAEWCLDYYRKYNNRPPGKYIEDLYLQHRDEFPDDEAGLIEDFLSGLSEEYERSEGFNAEYVLDRTKEYFRLTALKNLKDGLQQAIATGRPEEAEDVLAKYQRVLAKINSQSHVLEQFTAKEVLEMDIPEPRWAIPNLLPEGLSILGGKPKKGKSLFALNVLLAITCGTPALGSIAAERGSCIYLALEDTVRRLNLRISKMLKETPAPGTLHLFQQASVPRMPEGLTLLEAEIQKYSDLRLVVIDTWGKFKPPDRGKRTDPYGYDINVEDAGKLKALADRYNIAVLVLHHMRKTGSDDIVDTFHGSVGLTGTADGLLALVRKGQRPEAVLHVSGRDVESQEIALRLDAASLTWESMGDAALFQLTANRQAISDAILGSGGPMAPKAVAQATGLKLGFVQTTVQLMADRGQLVRKDRGLYDVPADDRIRRKMNADGVVPTRRRRGDGGEAL